MRRSSSTIIRATSSARTALERQYDSTLRGVDGQQRVLVDNMGRERQMENAQEAVPGKDPATDARPGSAGGGRTCPWKASGAQWWLLNPQERRSTGDGEPADFRSEQVHWPHQPRLIGTRSRTIRHKPLLNRAIQAQLAPGSTFKPIMAIAGLEAGVIDDETHFHCPGGASFYGHYFACHLKGGHGDISLHRGDRAIVRRLLL